MSFPVAAIYAGEAGAAAAASGWQVSTLLTTPLGSAYVPRALDIEADLLAGRLQRMEDTTKIYKGLVRQGLGWAKVFQRVRFLQPSCRCGVHCVHGRASRGRSRTGSISNTI